MIEEQLREKLARIIAFWAGSNHSAALPATYQILAVIKQNYVQLAEDQSLPPQPEFYEDWGGESGHEGYKLAQQDMLKAGFRRIKGGK